MKLLAILIMLAALFLLYRIACPKQPTVKQANNAPSKQPETADSVMGKSRYVVPDRSQPLPTPATSEETVKVIEKQDTFAAETAEQRSAEIPADELDEVFGDDATNKFMSIPLETESENDSENDSDESEVDFDAEEAEELNRVLGREPEYADGMDYDDLRTAAKVVKEQPDEVSEETAVTLGKLEDTDMFEWLVSGDEGKANWIRAVVERNVQKVMPETEEDKTSVDYGDFVADFLS